MKLLGKRLVGVVAVVVFAVWMLLVVIDCEETDKDAGEVCPTVLFSLMSSDPRLSPRLGRDLFVIEVVDVAVVA